MGPATVSISFVNQIWYVDNTNPGSDIGTSTDPFNTLAEASTAAGTNDTIFVYTGDGTDTGQSSGITLLNAQRLIGQGIALTIPDSVTQQGVVVPGPQTLLVAGTQPKISGASPGVTVFNVSAVISGLDITAGTGGGIGDDGVFVDCNAAAIRTVEISNNTIAGVRHGIEISNAGCTYELDISNNHITAAGAPRAGILVAGAGQPTFITNFDSNTVDGSVAGVLGTGIHITSVTFDANRTLPNFQQVTGGTTVIGESTDRVGVNGLVLGIAGGNEVSGNLVFTDLDILATGTGLAVVGSGALTAGTGFGLTVPDGSTIDSSTGVAIDLDPLTGVFGTSGGSQVTISGQSASFTDVAGMLFFSSSSALASTTAATAFSVSGGSGDLSYAGTIANTGGNSVVVTGRTSDTVSFTGAIDDDAAGISLTTNTGAAITFTGGLDLDTTTNTAFTATGGGTVTATSGTNTIDTTAGTGLNISGTTVNATFANVTQTAGTATCVNIANSPGTKNITSLKCTTTGVGVSLNAAGTFNVDSGGAPGGSFVSATGNTAFSSMATVLGVNLATMSGASASFINNTGSAILGVGGLTGIAGATFNVNQGSAMIDYDGSITNISGDSVSITNTTANGVDLSGTINDTGTGITVSGNSGGSNTFGGTTKTVNTGANTAVDLTNNTGATITFSGGGLNVDTTTVTAFNATGGGTINIGGSTNTIDSTSGTGMNLSGVTVALSGNGVNVTTTGGTGVNVGTGTTSITGSGTDGLDIVTSGTGTGFNATSGGTVSLTGTGNSVNTSSGTGTAVKIADTTIGAGDVIFQSVSANLAANGIFLDDTGSTGGFTVTGNAGDCDSSTPTCTGGDIRNTAGANGNTAGQGVHMNNVGGGVSLTRMRIGDHANFAIFGSNVTGFTLNTCLVDGANGNSAGDDEGSIEFNGLFGSASITASEILGGLENNITVENSSGVLNRLTIDGGTIIRNNSAAFGNDGLRFAAVDPSAGGTIMNLTVENSFFTANRGEHLDTDANGSAAMDIIFSGNTLSGGHANALSQSVLVSNSDSSDVTVTFGGTTNNSTGSLLTAFTFFQSSSTTSSSSLIGTFSGNTIGATGVVGSGSAQAHGLEINATGGGTVTMAVTGNIIRRFMTNGIQVLAGAGSRFTGPAGGEQS